MPKLFCNIGNLPKYKSIKQYILQNYQTRITSMLDLYLEKGNYFNFHLYEFIGEKKKLKYQEPKTFKKKNKRNIKDHSNT